jgi:hypothetical protein
MRAKRSIKDSLKEYLNWCVSRLLLGGSRNDTVRDMVDAISDEIASGGGVVSQDQLDQTVQDITKSYGIADQTVLTSAEQYTDQKIADVVDGSPEALDTLYELAKALGDDSNFATTVMDLIGQKLPTTTFENFIDNKAWTKDNLTKLSQLINNINSIKAGTRVESMDVNLASMSSYLRYDLFDANTTGTKPGNLTTGFLLTFSWDNGGWGAQIAISNGNIDGAIFLRTIKDSESDKIWGPWVKVWNSNNFNPDSKLNYSEFGGDLDTISTSGLYRLVSGCTNTPNSGSSQGCHIIHTNWDTNAAHQLYFEYYGSMFYRYKHGGEWSVWNRVWTGFEFNPDNYLPKNYPGINGGITINGETAVGKRPFLKFHIPGVAYSQFIMDESGTVNLLNGSDQTLGAFKSFSAGAIFSNGNRVWDSGNLSNATTSKAGLMSAADKTKLDGLSYQINVVGQASSTYIFPGDPSKLSEIDSPTTITSILGTASDFLDAFNNGKVFVSKTVTFSGVSVPSDITYNVLKSEDPDNPTIFSIIMSTVVWGHYIEITIDFKNNEYQAITSTINGRISVNTTGTSN